MIWLRLVKFICCLIITLLSVNASALTCGVTSDGLLKDAGRVGSFDLENRRDTLGSFQSGFTCSGFAPQFATATYLLYRIDSMSNTMVNKSDPSKTFRIRFYSDPERQNELVLNRPTEISAGTFLGLVTNSSFETRFYISAIPGQRIQPGRYELQTPVRLTWFWSFPAGSVLGLGWFEESPGMCRRCGAGTEWWGTGVPTSFQMNLEVLPDCRITTSNVNFGTQPFASKFQPVQTTMGIRCTTGQNYQVNLNNGQNAENGQRRMKSSNNYLNYEIYKNNSTERWGSDGQGWRSDQATINPGVYDSLTQQGYTFTTKILPNQDNVGPGNFTDNVIVEVKF